MHTTTGEQTATLWLLAQKIARRLNDEIGTAAAWAAVPPDPQEYDGKNALTKMEGCVLLRAEKEPEARLSLRANGYRSAGRLTVSAHWPRHNGQIYPHRDTDRPGSITVSLDKTPQQIARDLARRLHGAYMAALARGLEQMRQQREREDGAARLAEELAALAGTTPHRHRTSPGFSAHPGGPGGPSITSTNVYHDSVSLEIRGLSPEQARAVIRALTPATTEEAVNDLLRWS